MVKKVYPISTCKKCLRIYLACRTCGNSVFDLSKEGEHCRCSSGILIKVENRFCCQSYNHHLYKTCEHCGQVG